MLFGVHEILKWDTAYEAPNGQWLPARPMWSRWGRWKHAWWVLTGRCDAIYWPQDGNPYWDSPTQQPAEPK